MHFFMTNDSFFEVLLFVCSKMTNVNLFGKHLIRMLETSQSDQFTEYKQYTI